MWSESQNIWNSVKVLSRIVIVDRTYIWYFLYKCYIEHSSESAEGLKNACMEKYIFLLSKVRNTEKERTHNQYENVWVDKIFLWIVFCK
jgi:hypothetical protein